MADEYMVLSQDPTTSIDQRGRVIDVMRVYFRSLPSGVASYVDIPRDLYSATTVDAYIRQHRDQIEATQNL